MKRLPRRQSGSSPARYDCRERSDGLWTIVVFRAPLGGVSWLARGPRVGGPLYGTEAMMGQAMREARDAVRGQK